MGDAELDAWVFRKNPPDPDGASAQALRHATAAEALARFAGFHTQPRDSYAEAFAHRFPAQLARGPLTEHDPGHLLGGTITPPGRSRIGVRLTWDCEPVQQTPGDVASGSLRGVHRPS